VPRSLALGVVAQSAGVEGSAASGHETTISTRVSATTTSAAASVARATASETSDCGSAAAGAASNVCDTLMARAAVAGAVAVEATGARAERSHRAASAEADVSILGSAGMARRATRTGAGVFGGSTVAAHTSCFFTSSATARSDEKRLVAVRKDHEGTAATSAVASVCLAHLTHEDVQNGSGVELEITANPGAPTAVAEMLPAGALCSERFDPVGPRERHDPLLDSGTERHFSIELGIEVASIALSLARP